MKNLIDQGRVDRIDGCWFGEWRGSLPPLDESNRLPEAPTQIIVHDETRFFAQTRRRLYSVLEVLAREWRYHQPPRADQSRHGLTEGDATNNSSKPNRSLRTT